MCLAKIGKAHWATAPKPMNSTLFSKVIIATQLQVRWKERKSI
jgi:hypothetical protein